MQGHDIYIKLTDPNGRHTPVVTHHRVWDARKFVESQVELHYSRPVDEDKRYVEVVTQDEYRKANGYKNY